MKESVINNGCADNARARPSSGEHRLPACCRRQLADDSRNASQQFFTVQGSKSFSAGCRKGQAGSLYSPEDDTLLSRGIVRLRFGARRLKAKNCFALLHQIKAITRNRFQISLVCLEQVDLARLAREQTLLFVHLLLQIVDLCAAPHQFFVRRNKQAHNHKPDRDHQQDEKNSVQSLPDAGLATGAEIAVTVIHLAHCSVLHDFVTKFFFDSQQLYCIWRFGPAQADGESFARRRKHAFANYAPRDSRWQFGVGTHNHEQ